MSSSKYGLVKGKLEAHETTIGGIISCGWPGWDLAALAWDWLVCVIIIKESKWSRQKLDLLPDAIIIGYKDCKR